MVTETEHNNLWPPFYCAQSSILFTVVNFDTWFCRALQVLCLLWFVTNAFCIYSNFKMISIESKVDLINPSVSIFIESQLLKHRVHVRSFSFLSFFNIKCHENESGLGFITLKFESYETCGSYVSYLCLHSIHLKYQISDGFTQFIFIFSLAVPPW